jgi:hypothetical protein
MALLSREEILGADDLKTVDLYVPEWGGEVRLRTLTGEERDKFEASFTVQRGNKTKQNAANFRARLVSMCIVNEKGQRLFSPADINALGRKSVSALQRVFNKCNEMNGLSDEDVEELTEGFGEEAAEASTSD